MRGRLVGAAAFASALGCSAAEYFVCNGDEDCTGGAGGGMCQPTGGCSFADDTCETGQRYGASSVPSLAGECVQHGGGSDSSGAAQPTESTSTGDPQASGTTRSAEEGTTGTPVGTTGSACPSDWWDCNWLHRQRLDVAVPLSSTMSEVPVLVLLGPERVDYARMQADGEDVRLVTAAGVAAPYEVQRWDPQGVSIVWTNLEQLGERDDHLWLYYGNAVAQSAQAPADVWPDPYLTVLHVEGDAADSTAYGHDATPVGTVTPSEGQIGSGRDFTSTTARLDFGTTPGLADMFAGGGTLSVWIRARGWGGSNFGRIVDRDGGNTGWLFFLSVDGGLNFIQKGLPGPEVHWSAPADTVELLRWTYVALTFDSSGTAPPSMYIDGMPVDLDPMPENFEGPASSDAEIPLNLGNRSNGTRRFNGLMDEIRLEHQIRDPEWIAVQHASMRDALLHYGSIESWTSAP